MEENATLLKKKKSIKVKIMLILCQHTQKYEIQASNILLNRKLNISESEDPRSFVESSPLQNPVAIAI